MSICQAPAANARSGTGHGQSAIFIGVDFSVNRDQERKDVSVEVPAEELMLAGKLLELRIGRAGFFFFAGLVVKIANHLQPGLETTSND